MSARVRPATRQASEDALTIDVAEATGFALLGVMQATSPVNCDVALLAVEAGGALHAASSADAAELEEAVKYGTVISDVVFALLLLVGVHVVGGDFLQEIDVLVRVELGHFTSSGRLRALQLASQWLSQCFRVDACYARRFPCF